MKYTTEQVIQLYNKTHSVNQLYKQFGICLNKAHKILKDNGIPILNLRQQKALTRKFTVTEEIQICNMYRNHTSQRCIAKHFNVKSYLIRYVLRRYNMLSEDDTNETHILDNKHNEKVIIEKHKQGKTVTQLSVEYNIPAPSIRRILNNNNCLRKTMTPANLSKVPYDQIYQLGVIEQKTRKELAKHFNVPIHTIRVAERQYKLPLLSKLDTTIRINNNPEIQRYRITQGFRAKPYTLPSGKIIKLRGYEDDFLDHVFNTRILKEEDIIFSPNYVNYLLDGECHKYLPDFYIPKVNLIIEIKSRFTLANMKIKNDAKRTACIKHGFSFMFIIDKDYAEFDNYINTQTTK